MRKAYKGDIQMTFTNAELIAKITESNHIKKFDYVSTIFKQQVSINADGDLEVDDQDHDVNIKLDIPVHTFDSYIYVLLELRKYFRVACAYSKEPISHENCTCSHITADKKYGFVYWHSVYNHHILHSNYKEFNVYIYLSEFNRYANLLGRKM